MANLLQIQLSDGSSFLINHGVGEFIETQNAPNVALRIDPRGNVKAPVSDYKTTSANIFSCGDMRRGQSLVVWAIREGRQCAQAVDEYLMGTSKLPR